MPRTNTAKNKAEAKKNTVETPVEFVSKVDKTNFEYMQSLDYDDFVMCFEYIFLLREIHGAGGFIRTLKGFKEKLPECWEEIRKSNLLKWFGGKDNGFMAKWLNNSVYMKLKKVSINQMAQWFTYFDRSASYRTQMLKGENHQVLLITANKTIEEWLNEM